MSTFQDSQQDYAQHMTQRFMARAGRHRVQQVAAQWETEDQEKARLLRQVLRGFGVLGLVVLIAVLGTLLR